MYKSGILFQVTRGHLTWMNPSSLSWNTQEGQHCAEGPTVHFSIPVNWNVKRKEEKKAVRLANMTRALQAGEWEQLGPGAPCVCAPVFVMGKASCFQAVIRQPWGSGKTQFPFHLNCCTHPANWNLATGSLALSLECCQVTEIRECGIMAASDAQVLPLYFNSSVPLTFSYFLP